MRPEKELENLHKLNNDENSLNHMLDNYRHYIARITFSNTRNEITGIEEELASAFFAINRWKKNPSGAYLFNKLTAAKELKKALLERKIELGLDRTLMKPPEAKSPTLYKLIRQYGIDEIDNPETEIDPKTKRPRLKVVDLTKPEQMKEEVQKKKLEQIIEPKTDISPMKDLRDYYENEGVIKEIENTYIQTFTAISKKFLIYSSLSGSGKTFILDPMIKLIGEENFYIAGLSSDTALFHDADNINKAKFIVIPEYQKLTKGKKGNNIADEFAKDLGEGKASTRNVTTKIGETTNFLIEAGKGIFSTLADDEEYDLNDQFQRRFINLETDISPEQTELIKDSIANKRHAYLRRKKKITNKKIQQLSEHINYCIDFEPEYENPFANLITDTIPNTVKARTYTTHYLDMIEACAKFNYQDRIIEDNVLFVELEDIYNIHHIYWDKFCKSLFNIPLYGEELMGLYSDGETRTLQQTYELLREQDHSIKKEVIKKGLKKLTNAGFLKSENETARNPGYTVQFQIPNYRVEPDWGIMFEAGKSLLEEYYPEIAPKWVEKQETEGHIKVYNPVKQLEELISI